MEYTCNRNKLQSTQPINNEPNLLGALIDFNINVTNKLQGDLIDIGGTTMPKKYSNVHYGKINGINTNLKIKLGCKVMLTKNINIPVGLVNGCEGIVYDII